MEGGDGGEGFSNSGGMDCINGTKGVKDVNVD